VDRLIESGIPLLGSLWTVRTVGAVAPDMSGLTAAMALQVVVPMGG
jgi:hypothetical protein